MGVLGFDIRQAGGGGADWLPIIKYDARAGRFNRVDRQQRTDGGFDSIPAYIPTAEFRCIADLDNMESGWLDFAPGRAPSMVMARTEDIVNHATPLPAQPNAEHKQGVRIIVKLAAGIANGLPIREIASNAATFLRAIEEVYTLYRAERHNHPGKLPVLMLDGEPFGVVSGQGAKQSTNYQPKFRIVQWAPRGDIVPVPRAQGVKATTNGHAGSAPATGGTRVPPPAAKAAPRSDEDLSDFG